MPSSHSLKSILQTLRQSFYILGYAVLSAFVRQDQSLVLFLSDSQSQPTGNAAVVSSELTSRGYRVVAVTRPGLRIRRSLKHHFKLVILLAQARVIMVDDFSPMIYQLRLRKGTQLLQLWHASGAFKTMGFSREGKPGGPIKGSKTHKNYTAAITSSEAVRENYAQAFGITKDKVHATGIPRTDPFFDKELVARTREQVRVQLGIAEDRKLLLFAPTFRGNGQLTAHYDHSQIDWQDFANQFGSEYVIGVRMHPFVRDTPPILATDPRFIDLSSFPDPNALLMATDLLITDYSSIIFDFALLARPVIFYCPDLVEYTAARDFYYPFESYSYGPMCRDYTDLVSAVRTAAVDSAALNKFVEFFVSACDGHATARVVDQLIVPFLGPSRGAGNGSLEVLASSRHPGPKRPRGQVYPPGSSNPLNSPRPLGLSQPQDSSQFQPSVKSRLKVWGASAARMGLQVLYAPMKLLSTRNKVTLISRQADSPSVDFQLLEREFARALPDWQVKTLTYEFHSSTAKKLGYIPHVITQMRHIATSRVVILDTYCIPISALSHKKSLRVIQTWHAMGAIKKFGYSIVGHGEGASSGIARAMHMHRNYDAVLASSPAAVPHFAQAFNVPVDQVDVAPLPRTDLLTDRDYMAEKRRKLIVRFPELAKGKNIVFAPTFHKGQLFDAGALEIFFGERGFNFIAKPHPVSMAGSKPRRYAQVSSFDLLAVADFVVTDYSSIMVEAAVANIPVFILAPDLAAYRKKRSFYMDFEAEVPSPIAKTFDELLTNITDFDGDLTALQAFANKWVQLPQGQTCAAQVVQIATEGARPASIKLFLPSWGRKK